MIWGATTSAAVVPLYRVQSQQSDLLGKFIAFHASFVWQAIFSPLQDFAPAYTARGANTCFTDHGGTGQDDY